MDTDHIENGVYMDYQVALNEITQYLSNDESIVSALGSHQYTLKDIINATGVAMLLENEITTLGMVPDHEQLQALFNWLQVTMKDAIYYTHSLPEVFYPAKQYKKIGCGIICVVLSRELQEKIIWFRPCQLKEDTAVRWSNTEICDVMKLRDKMMKAISSRAGQIRLLNERLQRAYDELDTFSYTVSHDLRTPLTSIKSYTELVLLSNKSLDDKGRMLLERVVAGADKMSYLIGEILKLASLGKIEMEVETLDLDTIIRHIAVELAAALNARHVEISFGNLPPITGSAELITQVFTQLLDNAIKYTAGSERPKVTVKGTVTDDEVIYEIADNGIGIEAEHHEKVFELFKRMSNVQNIEGSGVGLAIVKKILEKHNARFWFESELKVGTVFYIAYKKTLW